jgi:hypothetical protein
MAAWPKVSKVMFGYAAVLVMGGLAAVLMAPVEANVATAVQVPGAAAAIVLSIAWLAACPASRKVGGVLAIVVPFLLALAILMPATARTRALENYPSVKPEWDAALAAGTEKDNRKERKAFFAEPPSAQREWNARVASGEAKETPEARKKFMRAYAASDHDITYLVVVLWTLVGASVLAGISAVVVRPRA